MTLPHTLEHASHSLRTARVLHVREDACEVWGDGGRSSIRFAPMFPAPRVERVSPGHLVAVASEPGGSELVVWRWYDAVVLGPAIEESIRLWEPGHGEVIARSRASYQLQEPGSRAYASAGLPGAEWWVAAGADTDPWTVHVELDEVDRLYTEHDLWRAVFAQRT